MSFIHQRNTVKMLSIGLLLISFSLQSSDAAQAGTENGRQTPELERCAQAIAQVNKDNGLAIRPADEDKCIIFTKSGPVQKCPIAGFRFVELPEEPETPMASSSESEGEEEIEENDDEDNLPIRPNRHDGGYESFINRP